MQSSPPRGASTKVLPSSPAASQYALDLGALGSPSSIGSPVAEREIPQVLSEDIDGPSDFTLNMIDWMKGGRGAAADPDADEDSVAITTGTPMFHTNESRLQPTVEAVEDYSSPVRPSNPTPLGGRTPASERSIRGTTNRSSMLSPMERQGGASQYLMNQIERLRSDLATEKQQRAAEKAFHMAEVERMSAQHNKELQAATSELRATRDAHTTEMRRISVEYSQQLRSAFEAAASDARKMSASHAAEIERLKHQHNEQLEAATSDAESLRSKIAQEEAAHNMEVERVRSNIAQEIHAALKDAQSVAASHAAEMAQLRSQLAQVQRTATKDAEQAAVTHANEMQRLKDEHKSYNTAKDIAITDKVNAREGRYKAKIALRDTKIAERHAENEQLNTELANLEKKYKAVSKELMRAWGREEFGDTGEKQKYRYKYTKASA